MIAFPILAGFSVFVGLLIGAAGIGGVLLVPFMAYALGTGVHSAIPAAMFGYIFAGAVGVVLYARHGSIRWRMAGWLILGVTPAAFAGALAATATAAQVLEAAIALLLLFAGYNALRAPTGQAEGSYIPGRVALIAIGAVAGFGSAVTGTGGPLILVPLLVWLRLPVLAAVGLSQATQLPLALLATAGNVVFGTIDYALATAVAVGLAIGVAIGARLAHAVAPAAMRRTVAWIIVIVGLAIAGRVAASYAVVGA